MQGSGERCEFSFNQRCHFSVFNLKSDFFKNQIRFFGSQEFHTFYWSLACFGPFLWIITHFQIFWTKRVASLFNNMCISLRSQIANCDYNTDIEEGETRPCAILIPAWGSIWVVRCVSKLHVWAEHENNNTLKAARHAKIVSAFVLRLLLRVWSAKTRRPSNWAPWLTTPLHGAV